MSHQKVENSLALSGDAAASVPVTPLHDLQELVNRLQIPVIVVEDGVAPAPFVIIVGTTAARSMYQCASALIHQLALLACLPCLLRLDL